MNSIKGWLLEQFPDHERAIHEKWGLDKAFQQKSHELQQVQVELDRLNAGADAADPGEVEPLRDRRGKLQRELLMMIGGNVR